MLNMTSERHLGSEGRMEELELGMQSKHKLGESGKQGKE